MSAIKMPVPAKVLLWSMVSVGLGLTAANSAQSHGVARPVTIAQRGNTVKVAPFGVNITLTEKARLRLQKPQETIVVSVDLYGVPKENSTITVNEVGLVNLTGAQVELPRAGRAPFNNLSIATSKLNQLADKDYTVNVNVFSGRRSSQDNLLSCDFFEGKVSRIRSGITLKCGLIGEYDSQYKR